MKDTTRRGFLAATGAGAAAVGASALTPSLASAAEAAPATTSSTTTPEHLAGSLVAHISDTRTGTVSIYVGQREVVVHDRALVARLVAASK